MRARMVARKDDVACVAYSAAVAHQARCARPVAIVRVRAQQPRVGPEAGRLRRPALAVEHTAQDVEQRQRERGDEQREAPVRGAVDPAAMSWSFHLCSIEQPAARHERDRNMQRMARGGPKPVADCTRNPVKDPADQKG